ncbi:MAG: hypothetical protein ACYCWE_15275 [Eubacteriales bacterium]
MKKIICSLLILSVILSLPACMGDSSETASQTSAGTTNTIETEAETEVNDNLPEFNYESEDFNLLISIEEFWGDSVHITEMTGDNLDDARFTTVSNIEERFNVKITEFVQPFEKVNNGMRKLIAAGDDSYDWIFLRDSFADTFVQNGLLVEYSDLPYVDLTQVYWDQKLLAASTINNRCYYTFGSFDTTYIDRTHCMVFNKQMAENYNISDLYAMAESGTWTIDAMAATMTNVTADINGDNKLDKSDQWGYLCAGKQVLVNFWTAAGEQTVKKDEDDLLYFGLTGNERFENIISKVFTVFRDGGTWFPNLKGNFDIPQDAIEMFIAGQSLYLDENFIGIKSLRVMELDFGILPYPKYEEIQEHYYARIEAAYKVGCVPITNTDLEMTSVLMEALNCLAYKTVIPAYYEVTLKGKVTRDSESEAMLDIIFNNMFFDYGDTWWCDAIRDGIFGKMFNADDRNYASKLASVETAVNKHINKTLPAYID